MNDVTIILLLVAITTGLSLAAVSIRVPYPTAMVIAGLIIGAAVFSSEAKVLQFYDDFQINYPVIMGSYELMYEYGHISAIPTTFIIDREGKIADTIVGYRNQAQYESLVLPLLAE